MYLHEPSNTIIYEPPDPALILRNIKDARPVVNGYVGVPATLYNLQLLRYLGFTVPPPMANYDWPIRRGRSVLSHQKIMSNFQVVNPRCFNLSDMGTMKTASNYWAADYVMLQYPKKTVRTIIVCTCSTMLSVWHDEIFLDLLGRRTAVVIYGSKKRREKLLDEDHDFYIVNHDGVAVIENALSNRPDIRIVIVDEGSADKDRTTKRHKIKRRLLAPRDYYWHNTGTPTAGGPLDAYGQAKLVNNANGESYFSYRDRTMHRISQFKWIPKSGAHVEAYKLMQPAVRFAIEDCVDLPEMSVQKRDVELSAEQGKAFKEMKRDLQVMIKEKQVNAANEAVLRMKLIQISCGAVYGPSDGSDSPRRGDRSSGRTVHYLDSGPRISVLREVIEQAREKIIIFAPLTSVLHMLHKELDGYTRAIVNGEVSQKDRSEIFRAFQQDENPRIIIADPGTMSHGLTLTAATTIIWYAPVDRTELFLQANKRIHRPGQTKTCVVVQLAATSIEREIYRRLEANESLQGLVLQLARGEV